MRPPYILTVRCPDVRGIVASTTTFLAEQDCSIVEAHQHQDGGMFFMRVAFETDGANDETISKLEERFRPIAARLAMEAHFHDRTVKPRVLLMVSKFGHCLFDLLNRWRAGQLPADIVGVVSNHDDMRSFVEWNGLPYHHFPVTKETKAEQERKIIDLVESANVDLVVLARYMQILSPTLCAVLSGRCINIHHSFLPSFKGAKPYHQAHARGVKVIGATAHYVTTDLDEGPIIEQDTRRVNHARGPEDLVVIGQEVECSVLGRAVQWHLDRRVMMNGTQTIVFE
ncbi:MAG: formyltetrahydrofolate deformylase [Sphingopyxis sp.]|nr:formyltetrahydrofolate deformylase [Sphingopyxis sp.]